MIMKGSTMEPNGSQMVTKMELKGCQTAAKMVHEPIQNDPVTSNWASPAKLQFWDGFWMHLGAAQGSTLVPKKSDQKICPKNDVEKYQGFNRMSSEMNAKINPKAEPNVEQIGTHDFSEYPY